jgi:hypothetical protein
MQCSTGRSDLSEDELTLSLWPKVSLITDDMS